MGAKPPSRQGVAEVARVRSGSKLEDRSRFGSFGASVESGHVDRLQRLPGLLRLLGCLPLKDVCACLRGRHHGPGWQGGAARSAPECGQRAIFLSERHLATDGGRALLIEHPNRCTLAIAARRGTKGDRAGIEHQLPVDAPARGDGFIRRLGAA
jgi:hypothetical protein